MNDELSPCCGASIVNGRCFKCKEAVEDREDERHDYSEPSGPFGEESESYN